MGDVAVKKSLIVSMANRYGVDEHKLLDTLKATAFKGPKGQPVSNEQMMALMLVADQYNLNPFTKEIHAFPDRGGIVPVVGLDGWAGMINRHPEFDGMDFDITEESVTCRIYRKDRAHPVAVTEYMDECRRDTQPWKTHPRRMLRHKALIQCARVAFGYTGIYDPDEASAIVEREVNPDKAKGSVVNIDDILAEAQEVDDAYPADSAAANAPGIRGALPGL